MVWRYDGNGPKPDGRAGFSTYIFFNDRGTVEGVVVIQTADNMRADIRTESGYGFGTKMFDLVKRYEWPEPLSRVGGLYLCPYPKSNVTFALDGASRKVVCIAIGMSLAVMSQTGSEVVTTTLLSPAAGPGGLLPGLSPEPARPRGRR